MVEITNRLAFDPYLAASTVRLPSNVSMPVDFHDGTLHTLFSRTIPGGALGENGELRIDLFGSYNSTTSPFTLSCTATGYTTSLTATTMTDSIQSVSSGALGSPAFEGQIVFQNQGAESSTRWKLILMVGNNASAGGDIYLNTTQAGGTGPIPDTATDWTLTVGIQSRDVLVGASWVYGLGSLISYSGLY